MKEELFNADYVRSLTLATDENKVQEEFEAIKRIITEDTLMGFRSISEQYETRLCYALANKLAALGFTTEVSAGPFDSVTRLTLKVSW